jgi:hypothetical protein
MTEVAGVNPRDEDLRSLLNEIVEIDEKERGGKQVRS